MHKYRFIAEESCCGDEPLIIERTIVSTKAYHSGTYNKAIPLSPAIVTYKALIYYFDKQSNYSVKRVGLVGSSSTIGQVAQSVGSYVLPGNISPLRSPIRSGVFGALTPGTVNIPNIPGLSRVKPSRRRVYRCPEGYQYGGRFTDNRLSTCGQKLFDIPSALGLAIGALKKLAREIMRVQGSPISGTPLTGGEYSDPLDSRRPQIPRVAEKNQRLMDENIAKLLRDMGKPGINATRMVRRDGFVLEPVVSARVLRSVPDNRDMEEATYIITANKLASLGQDELGLLSNTGINQLIYVLPDGSTLSLRKTRPLSIGERRKLGRTVNTAASIDNSTNPTARLQEVAKQTGEGIEYSERFETIKNPHQIVKLKNGRTVERWVYELLGNGRKKETPQQGRQSSSVEAIQRKITTLDAAAEHLAAGGSMSDVSPMVLAEALTKANLMKREKLAAGIERVIAPDKREYTLYQPKVAYEHINASFSSDLQQHLGIESPDVSIVGVGDRRQYLIEAIGTTYPGITPSEDKTLADVSTASVAKLLVSDFLSGVENRSPSSIDILEIGDETIAAPIFNDSNLTALADIKIRQQTKQLIEQFKSLQETGIYGRYYRELQERQRREILQELRKLIDRARLFNYVHFLQRLSIDGQLTDAEKRHIKIVQRISEQRVGALEGVLEVISKILKAK